MTDKEKIETLEKRVCDMETFWKEQVSCRVTINAQQYFDRGMWWALKICTVREGPYPQWIKVSPATLPKNYGNVLVTVMWNEYGTHKVISEYMTRYNPDSGTWEYEIRPDRWCPLPDIFTVTHWMPYPEPAED